MESEYIALSQAMRDLIPIREMVKSLLEVILGNKQTHSILNALLTPMQKMILTYCLLQLFMKTTLLVCHWQDFQESHHELSMLLYLTTGLGAKFSITI
jgi:hypothetical protein